MDIIEQINDPDVFGPLFPNLESWRAWLVFLKATFGLPIVGRRERRIFRNCTGRTRPPTTQAREVYAICGRRGGKSFISSLVCVWMSLFYEWREVLRSGERGKAFIIANDRQQARIIKSYITEILTCSPSLKAMVKKETAESIELANGIDIEIKTCSFRSVRGFSIIFACLEELAFWRDLETSANPAAEILTSLRPGLATVPGSLALGISTPFSRAGLLFKMHRDHFGHSERNIPLIWQADSRTMNPTISKKLVKDELRKDKTAASSEWLAEWRADISNFIPPELIVACTVEGRLELPAKRDVEYFAFCDPSGGRNDSMTLAICHREGGRVILDALREEKPPFKPSVVVADFCDVLNRYGVSLVRGDKYAAEWCTSEFQNHNVHFSYSEKTASEFYLNFLPMLSNRSVELLDSSRLASQLAALERRARAGGRDIVSHSQGLHDDVSNSCAGACVHAASVGSLRTPPISFGEVEYAEDEEEKLARESTSWLLDKLRKKRKDEDKELEEEMREMDEEIEKELAEERKSEGRTKHGW